MWKNKNICAKLRILKENELKISNALIWVFIPDRVKPSFVIFDIRALWRAALNARVPRCQKLQVTAWPELAHDAL